MRISRFIIRAPHFVVILGSLALTLRPYDALAAAQIRAENKPLVDAISGAQRAAKAGRFAEALAKAKDADAIEGKPAGLTRAIHQMVVHYAISANDCPSAIAELEKMTATSEDTEKEEKLLRMSDCKPN